MEGVLDIGINQLSMLAKFGISSFKELQNLKIQQRIKILNDLGIKPFNRDNNEFYIPIQRKSTAFEPQIELDFVDLCEL